MSGKADKLFTLPESKEGRDMSRADQMSKRLWVYGSATIGGALIGMFISGSAGAGVGVVVGILLVFWLG